MAAERALLSPAVFTSENDQTFLTQGIANIGGAFIGPFPKGPGFSPTLITSQADLETIFGVPDGIYYTPYAAQQYLKHSGTVTIVRTGYLGGYIQKDPIIIKAVSGSMTLVSGSYDLNTFTTSSGQEQKVLAILANTAYDTGQLWEGFASSSLIAITSSNNAPTTNFKLELRNSGSLYGNYNFSLDNGDPAYLANVFGGDPLSGYTPTVSGSLPKAAYIYKIFNGTINTVVNEMINSGSWKIEISTYDNIDPNTMETELGYAMNFNDGIPGGGDATHAGSAYDLTNAHTPWITSQNMNGTKYELFRIHTLSDGTSANKELKVQISDIKLAGTIPGSNYGSFTLTVRRFYDSDRRPEILESFTNLSMDPNSANFFGRRIGDYYNEINADGKIVEYGEYQNKSKYIRLELTKAPYPEAAVPYGFRAYVTPIGGKYANYVPAMSYTRASIYSKNIGRYPSGVAFNAAPLGADDELLSLYPAGADTGPIEDNLNFFSPTPMTATTGNNIDFDLETICGIPSTYDAAVEFTNVKKRKFILGFQGGFDGQSPAIYPRVGNDILPQNQQGFDCSSIVSSGSVAYKQCLAALSNADEFDINLMVMPGINYSDHSYVSQLAIDVCENRGDTFLILDLVGNQTATKSSIDNIISKAEEIDSNYVASYYPWVKIIDTNTNKQVIVPPSVVIPGVYAQSDAASETWFAPAGLNRGGITQAIQVMDRLTHDDRDRLYNGKVNPIASFPGQGIVVWGQKTLQQRPSALDRVNVRRLLITLKKFIASVSRYLIFEQNTSQTQNRFLSIVNPYLESVQQRSGIYAFKVVCDNTNNTPDIIDRNILMGNIYLKPTRSVEYIVIPFSLYPTGASFDTI